MIKDIYSDPDLYDAAHSWKTNDIEFITNAANEYGSPVLELGSGTGRLALPLMNQSHNYTGIESSSSFVKCAKNKLESFGNKATVLEGDMRSFDLDQKFNFIFIGFNSIFHLMNEKDVLSFFKCIKKHLTDDGTFLIDTFIPDPLFLYRDKQKYYVMEFDTPDGMNCIVSETNDYHTESQINHINWFFNYEGKDEPEVFTFDMHMIFPDTMDRLLMDAGLKIKEKYGDYEKTPLGPESQLQIYTCGK